MPVPEAAREEAQGVDMPHFPPPDSFQDKFGSTATGRDSASLRLCQPVLEGGGIPLGRLTVSRHGIKFDTELFDSTPSSTGMVGVSYFTIRDGGRVGHPPVAPSYGLASSVE